jgi:hypothetical protein
MDYKRWCKVRKWYAAGLKTGSESVVHYKGIERECKKASLKRSFKIQCALYYKLYCMCTV